MFSFWSNFSFEYIHSSISNGTIKLKKTPRYEIWHNHGIIWVKGTFALSSLLLICSAWFILLIHAKPSSKFGQVAQGLSQLRFEIFLMAETAQLSAQLIPVLNHSFWKSFSLYPFIISFVATFDYCVFSFCCALCELSGSVFNAV